jgi:3-oxoacyl-[acyl-carrier protein] reductase
MIIVLFGSLSAPRLSQVAVLARDTIRTVKTTAKWAEFMGCSFVQNGIAVDGGSTTFCDTIGGIMNLTNAVALITGGTAGIGRSIAKTLAESGARVAITGRDKDRLEAAARTLGVFPIHADVSNEADVIRSYREALAKFGDLDILVNNAGVGVFKSLVDMDRANFDNVFAINVTGAMLMGREAAKHFIKRNRGAIINIASTAGLRGAANGTAYYASKFALRGMTECWRAELRKYNIRVMLVNPSEVITNFAASAGIAQKSNETKLRGEEIAYAVKAILEMDDRGFTPELSIFATNPID